jgi:glycine/D-amino acid oxidase-like deaminating enzyme
MMLTRRQCLIASALSLSAPAVVPAQTLDADLPPLRPGEWLPVPDFERLTEPSYLVGSRPYRRGGVRLEVDDADDIPPRKVLIHNYGHGGAGITLAFGSAQHVREMLEQHLETVLRRPPAGLRVAVVGAGAIGLATADELKRWNPALVVSVLANNIDPAGRPVHQRTTSWIAGGQFEPSLCWREYDRNGTLPVLHDLVRRSHRRILALKSARTQRQYGIVDRKNYVLATGDSAGFDTGMPRDVIPAAREGLLPFRPLGTVAGREYSTFLINPTVLMPKLVADLTAARVPFLRRDIRTRADLIGIDADVIVNCTGLGAAAMLGDTSLFAVRGQLVVLRNPAALKYLFSGGCGNRIAYLFARQSDIVIGGTADRTANNDDVTFGSYRVLLDRVRRIFSGDVADCVAPVDNGGRSRMELL